jgi:hypothetical protein
VLAASNGSELVHDGQRWRSRWWFQTQRKLEPSFVVQSLYHGVGDSMEQRSDMLGHISKASLASKLRVLTVKVPAKATLNAMKALKQSVPFALRIYNLTF